MQRRTFALHALALGAGAALGTVPAFAQAPWPTGKTITYLVPFAAGGTTDTLGRLISQQLGTALGTTVVVDNKGGAGGSVGSEIAARAAPDGYTLLGGHDQLACDQRGPLPEAGLRPGQILRARDADRHQPGGVGGGRRQPLQDAAGRTRGGEGQARRALVASAGTGTSQHLALELLAYRSGVKFTHVPYKGSGPAIQDVIGGQVDMMFDTTVVAAPHIQSGKLRAIAVTSAKRLASMPDVPTV
ncbi:Bug family tripartite tricarboxylate transporter substrate binding protein, partial [Paracidovorax cattleyae]|uniref:Bug family tripartite tricarboxylate transporter substrate binding protein n=1 Tax=Paracidovorax cattleyae TaxID=80868 RepID=UPI003EB8BADB